MISKLTIDGFKGFEHLEFPRLTRVTLLGGRNNVGKTSVLEAMFMFLDRMNPQMILRQFAWRGIGVVPFDPDTMWAPVFSNYDMSRPITIDAMMGKRKEKMTIQFNPNYVASSIRAKASRPGMLPTEIRTDQQPRPSYALDITFTADNKTILTSHLLTGPEGTGLHIDYANETIHRSATFLGARMYASSQEDAARFGQLDVLGQQGKIVEFLQIIEPKLKSLSSIAVGDTTIIHGDIGLKRKIPISYMGDGVSRMLSIILAIATSKNGIVFIDELENGLHYSVMPKIWEGITKAANEFNCQVIATTHSYECLQAAYEGLSEGYEDDFTYVRIDKLDNKIVAKLFDFKLLKVAIESNMEVR